MDFFPSPFVLAAQSPHSLADAMPVAKSVELISRGDPEVLLSVSSFRTPKGFSSSSSVHSPLLSTVTHMDTNIMGGDMHRGEEEAPGKVVTSSPSSSKSSTVADEVPSAVNPYDALTRLPDGDRYIVDVDDLVHSMRESVQQIENWYEETSA